MSKGSIPSDTIRTGLSDPTAESGRALPFDLIRALRPKQWLKNLLVFAAPLAAGSLMQGPVIAGTLIAFVTFCLAASATYLINDIRDIDVDRVHPKKRFRPIASGQIGTRTAASVAVVLMVVALAIAFWQSIGLGWTVLAYVVSTLSYSLGLKHEPVLELLLLSLGFMLRAIAGGVATGIPLSQWFLIVAGFGSLFMAAGKRYSELNRLNGGGMDPSNGEQGRRVLAGYTTAYLRFVVALAAGVTVTAYCLWAFEVGGTQVPPWSLISVFPFVLALMRYGADIFRGEAETPENAVLTDKVLLVAGVVWMITFGLGAVTA